ncbi:TCR/Tet family MFS transporter [Olivibacter jilunii]|uniref:TCR/Tet family MFS transporter n=1 Tax=Olivibacter jilunii TaxID=985016 RepID=UPI003F1866CC
MKNKRTLFFVTSVVMLDTIGFGIIYPVLPKLIVQLTGGELTNAARYSGWLSFAYASMQFLFAPILGGLSDRYGRRPILLASIAGFTIDSLFMVFAPTIQWLFAGRLIAGVSGASYSVASATIADISTEETRTKNFGLINAAYGAGFVIGPALGGLLGVYGTHMPFIAAGILGFLNLIFGQLFFPESLGSRSTENLEQKKGVGIFEFLKKSNKLILVMCAIFLIALANQCMPNIWAYYTMEKFNWTTLYIGYSLAFLGVLTIVCQVWLIRLLKRVFSDTSLIVFGLVMTALALGLLAFSTSLWLVFVSLIFYVIGSVQRAGFQSLASSHVPEGDRGKLQGSIAAVMGLSTIAAPPIMTNVFSFFTTPNAFSIYFPGMPYLLSTVLTLLSMILVLRLRKGN